MLDVAAGDKPPPYRVPHSSPARGEGAVNPLPPAVGREGEGDPPHPRLPPQGGKERSIPSPPRSGERGRVRGTPPIPAFPRKGRRSGQSPLPRGRGRGWGWGGPPHPRLPPQGGKERSSVVPPLVVGNRVRLRRHPRAEPPLRQLRLEFLPNPRLLGRVVDLVAGSILHALGMARELAQRMKGEVARRLAAQVEVLVEPAVRRDEEARLVPRDHDLLLPLFPQDREALAARDHDDAPGSVSVRALVGSGGEHRHVAGQL